MTKVIVLAIANPKQLRSAAARHGYPVLAAAGAARMPALANGTGERVAPTASRLFAPLIGLVATGAAQAAAGI